MTDEQYMKLALNLAEKGAGHTSPNPLVGAVIVKDDKIIGSGYHKKYGELHAERNAFASLLEPADGATLYVTLEPCCHYGKTPPCTEAIIEHHIKKVVIASMDPNPLVGGKGAAILKEHGIEVVTGVLERDALDLNQPFFQFIQHKVPYVVMKYAMTADGKIATHTGASKWITSEEARNHVHKLRNRYSAIMIGIQTVLTDNPLLTCRIPGGVNPIRIICDTHLRIPLSSQIVNTAKEVPTYVAFFEDSFNNASKLEKAGVQLIKTPLSKDGHLNLFCLMQDLGRKNIDSILLEGGATLNESFLKENLVHSLFVYIAPKIFGGADAKSPVSGTGVDTPAQAYAFSFEKAVQMGEDILLTYKKKEQEESTCLQGIIEETGTITSVHHGPSSSALSIRGAKVMEDVQIGDSIAVNGVCLTVCSFEQNVFNADVMNETLKRTSLSQLKSGSLVNLERAMPANGRFGGHIVSGHIDGTGTLIDKKPDDIAMILTIRTTAGAIIGCIIEKGSVALDGISLTVCGVSDKKRTFQVSIIPHTASHTTLLSKKLGDTINIENDIVGKYIKKFLTPEQAEAQESSITKEFLIRNGF